MEIIEPNYKNETKSRPSILGRATKFIMWNTVGKYQVDQAVYRVLRDEADPSINESSPAAEENRQAALRLFERYSEELHLSLH